MGQGTCGAVYGVPILLESLRGSLSWFVRVAQSKPTVSCAHSPELSQAIKADLLETFM